MLSVSISVQVQVFVAALVSVAIYREGLVFDFAVGLGFGFRAPVSTPILMSVSGLISAIASILMSVRIEWRRWLGRFASDKLTARAKEQC